ncbi:MAG: Protein of unknown function (DUF973) [uncultured Acidilobus sp. OSP8]|nr:MAG: Protein of unknown function (DUF973) [uncultured Acidilobus sp. OSP8]
MVSNIFIRRALSQLDELEGVRRLRSGVLLLILIPVIILILALVGAAAIYAAVTSAPVSSYSGSSLVGGVTVLLVVLSLISLVLIVMAFGRLRGGFSLLSAAGRGGSTGVTGAWLLIIAAIIALPGEALLMFGGFIVSLIASVIGDAGYILIGKGLYDVGSSYGKDSLKTGGALVVISFAVLILIVDLRGLLSYAAASGVPALLSLAVLILIFAIMGFIGLILSYTTLGDIERELQAKASQAGAQQATTTS